MKKLLALVLVLGMASMASAALQISVHLAGGGETWNVNEPVPSTISIRPSDTLLLDVWTDSAISPAAGGEGYFVLVTNPAEATIGLGGTAYFDVVIPDYSATGQGYIGFPAGLDGINLEVFDLGSGTIPAGSVLADGIPFHCVSEPSNTVVSIYGVDASWNFINTVLDSVTIHQTPEPMTMALLGLGGLGLVRRRRR